MSHNNNICQVYFRLKFNTNPGEYIRIAGSIEEIGSWNPQKGLLCKPDETSPSYWVPCLPLRLLKGINIFFEFQSHFYDRNLL